MMARKILPFAAWLVLGFIAFATLSPIGWRPQSLLPVDLERAAAFALAGLLFGLAYPRHVLWAGLVLALGIVGLELLQTLRPDRHGRELDVLVKFGGAVLGLGLGWLAARRLPQR
ncbi:MAG: VanZ family protein [Devosia sp.]|nr:VanZ family protein [Devosia sp.]